VAAIKTHLTIYDVFIRRKLDGKPFNLFEKFPAKKVLEINDLRSAICSRRVSQTVLFGGQQHSGFPGRAGFCDFQKDENRASVTQRWQNGQGP
jgi:hypothetical protein